MFPWTFNLKFCRLCVCEKSHSVLSRTMHPVKCRSIAEAEMSRWTVFKITVRETGFSQRATLLSAHIKPKRVHVLCCNFVASPNLPPAKWFACSNSLFICNLISVFTIEMFYFCAGLFLSRLIRRRALCYTSCAAWMNNSGGTFLAAWGQKVAFALKPGLSKSKLFCLKLAHGTSQKLGAVVTQFPPVLLCK